MPKLDPASELIRESLINYNPAFKTQFSAMNKVQLRNEVQGMVNEKIKGLKTLVEAGIKSFSSRDELIKAAIKEVCNEELQISTRTYNEFMNSF